MAGNKEFPRPVPLDSGRSPTPSQESRRTPPGGPIRFGRFELDLEQEELRRNGRPVKLQDQPLKVLRLLALRPGKIVRREEIRQALWEPGTWVDFEQGINHCIRQLRSVLGDDAESPRYIETLPRKGYRFIAPVMRRPPGEATEGRTRPRRASWSSWLPHDPLATARDHQGDPSAAPWTAGLLARRLPWFGILIGLAALAGAAVLGAVFLPAPGPAAGPGSVASDERPMLAVLPFDNLTGDAGNDYLSEGLTEELITQLGRGYARKMGVIARTSVMRYAEDPPPADVIGRELGADYLLEGSIRRGAGRLRVTAQLVRTDDQSHLWATNYDRPLDDLIEVQTEVSRRIADALALYILDPQDRDAGRAAARPEAYQAYLRARHLLYRGEEGDAQKALAELQSAVEIDPGFARGWSALGMAWRVQDLTRVERAPRVREAALKALSLDDSVEEAWLLLAMTRFYHDLDPEGARAAFQHAIESHPGYALAHHHFSAYWSVRGEHDKALASVQRALALDPLAPAVNADVGLYYYYARRYDEAIAASKRTLEISPGYMWAQRSLLLALLAKGDIRAALEAGRAEMVQRRAPPEAIAAVDPDHPEAALRAYWMWDLDRWEELSRRQKVQPAVIGLIYAGLGYPEAAIFTLERAYEARSGWMTPFLRVEPLADPLRTDPRFQSLIARLETTARASL